MTTIAQENMTSVLKRYLEKYDGASNWEVQPPCVSERFSISSVGRFRIFKNGRCDNTYAAFTSDGVLNVVHQAVDGADHIRLEIVD